MFDNGSLRERPEESQRIMESLMMPLLGKYFKVENRLRIVEAHDSIVERLFAVRSSDDIGNASCRHTAHLLTGYFRARLSVRLSQASFIRLPLTSIGVQKRFARAMQKYCNGVLIYVKDQSSERSLSLGEIIATRRNSAGCRPLYHLVEYAHCLRIPDTVFDNPLIQELEDLGVDMVAM